MMTVVDRYAPGEQCGVCRMTVGVNTICGYPVVAVAGQGALPKYCGAPGQSGNPAHRSELAGNARGRYGMTTAEQKALAEKAFPPRNVGDAPRRHAEAGNIEDFVSAPPAARGSEASVIGVTGAGARAPEERKGPQRRLKPSVALSKDEIAQLSEAEAARPTQGLEMAAPAGADGDDAAMSSEAAEDAAALRGDGDDLVQQQTAKLDRLSELLLAAATTLTDVRDNTVAVHQMYLDRLRWVEKRAGDAELALQEAQAERDAAKLEAQAAVEQAERDKQEARTAVQRAEGRGAADQQTITELRQQLEQLRTQHVEAIKQARDEEWARAERTLALVKETAQSISNRPSPRQHSSVAASLSHRQRQLKEMVAEGKIKRVGVVDEDNPGNVRGQRWRVCDADPRQGDNANLKKLLDHDLIYFSWSDPQIAETPGDGATRVLTTPVRLTEAGGGLREDPTH